VGRTRLTSRQRSHRGAPNPAEFRVGAWVGLGVIALVCAVAVVDIGGDGLLVAIGLLASGLALLWEAARVARREYPEIAGDKNPETADRSTSS